MYPTPPTETIPRVPVATPQWSVRRDVSPVVRVVRVVVSVGSIRDVIRYIRYSLFVFVFAL